MQIFVLTATHERMLKYELLRYVMLYKYYMPKSCLEKASSKMVVVFVWMLIFTIATGFYALYLPDLYHRNIVCFWVLVTIFTVAFLLLIISYARVTCTSPGQPSSELTTAYERQGKLEELISYTEKRKIIQKERQKKQFRHDRLGYIEIEEEIQAMKRDQYCKKCRIARPARSHHCSVCEKCVVRMDHHCPWTGNCIGRDNHKYFILFLGYASFGLAIVAFSVLIDWITKSKVAGESENNLKIYGLPLIGIASILLFLSIGFLFFAQLVAAISNITTLQTFLDSIEQHAPFDNGPQKNMEEIFGKQGWAFLPTKPKFDVITQIY